MTQPTPATGLDSLKWEDGLLQILGMAATDRTKFYNVPWISLIDHEVFIYGIKYRDPDVGDVGNNEFSFFRYLGNTTGGSGKPDYWYLTVRGRVDWFVGNEGDSPHERFSTEFWDRSRDMLFSPPVPLVLDPKSFHSAAESMYNTETWLLDAIATLQREMNDTAGTLSGAAATAYRESLEDLRKGLQVLHDDLQSSQNWTEMLHANGHAAENFWSNARATWSNWASNYANHRPNEIIARVLNQIRDQARANVPSPTFTLDLGDGVPRQYNFAFPNEFARLDQEMHLFFKQGLDALDQEMRGLYGTLRNSLDLTVTNMLTPSQAPAGSGPGAGGPGGVPDLKGGAGAPDLKGGADTPDLTGGADTPDLTGGADTPDLTGGADTPDLTGGADTPDLTGGVGGPDLGDLPPASGFESEMPGLGDDLQAGTGTGMPDLGVPGAPGGFGDGGLGLGDPTGGTLGPGLGTGGTTGGIGALPPGGFGTGGLGSIGSPTGGSGRPSLNDSKPGSGVIGGPGGDFLEGPTTIDTDDLPGGKPLPGLSGGTGAEIGGDRFGGMSGERAPAGMGTGGMQVGPLGPAPLASSMAGTGSAAVPAAGSPYGAGTPTGPMGPMGPMGGGGGMGGGGEEKDRERKTWLAEEEDVWGTEPDVLVGVIGRDDIPDGPGESTRPAVPQTPATPYGPARGTGRQSRGY
ncbi:WXG100 family type VII secretion target [Micromonospora violae]|uniref:WXG100 family type VII secretion target n=1 Tax=Micromonospora violae TaxID=1278207 RepID=UPI0033E7F870